MRQGIATQGIPRIGDSARSPGMDRLRAARLGVAWHDIARQRSHSARLSGGRRAEVSVAGRSDTSQSPSGRAGSGQRKSRQG